MPKFLAIRLTKNESDVLTRVRATRELKFGVRLTIRMLLSELIADAYVAHLERRLKLPVQHTLPEIPDRGAFEQISFELNDEHKVSLNALKTNGDGHFVDYGEADIIRQLIQQADAKKF